MDDESHPVIEAFAGIGNHHLGILADILEGRVLATGMSYGGGTIFDGQADISITPFPFIDIHGGYPIFLIDADAEDVEFGYDTSGPYVALTIGFYHEARTRLLTVCRVLAPVRYITREPSLEEQP
jgi:hypothetical protein